MHSQSLFFNVLEYEGMVFMSLTPSALVTAIYSPPEVT